MCQMTSDIKLHCRLSASAVTLGIVTVASEGCVTSWYTGSWKPVWVTSSGPRVPAPRPWPTRPGLASLVTSSRVARTWSWHATLSSAPQGTRVTWRVGLVAPPVQAYDGWSTGASSVIRSELSLEEGKCQRPWGYWHDHCLLNTCSKTSNHLMHCV